MTEDQTAEFDLLKLANEHGKFALSVVADDAALQKALERLQLRGWVQLIDVCPLPQFDAGSPRLLFRVFRADARAMTWFRSRQ